MERRLTTQISGPRQRVRCIAVLGALAMPIDSGFDELQSEHDLTTLVALGVMALTDFVAHIAELAEVLVVPLSVCLLEKVQLPTVGLVSHNRAITPSHLHITELSFAGIREPSFREPAVAISIRLAGWAGEREYVGMVAARGDSGLAVATEAGMKIGSSVIDLPALEHGPPSAA